MTVDPSRALLWVVTVAFGLLALVRGLRFRRGQSPGLTELYRRVDLPAIVRNLPIAAPLLGTGLVLIALLTAPMFVGVDVPIQIPGDARGPVASVLGGLSFVWFAIVAFVLCRPKLVIPPWLKLEDEKMGHVHPPLGTMDRAILVWGALVGVFGVALIGLGVYLLLQLATRP